LNKIENKRLQTKEQTGQENHGNHGNLLDDDNPEINQQPLQLTQYVPPPPKKKNVKQKLGRWCN